jgi:hypothetical protein
MSHLSFVPKIRTLRRVGVAGLAATALLGATAGTAGAAGAQSTRGDLRSGDIHVTFAAKRAAGAPATSATGTFVAEGAPVSVFGLPKELGRLRLSGPITCLETKGQDVSFYYPFDDKTTSGLLGQSGSGVLVSLRKNSQSEYRLGFSPMLSAFVPFTGCDFGVTPFVVTGGGWQNVN